MGTTGIHRPGKDTGHGPIRATWTSTAAAATGLRRAPLPADLAAYRSPNFIYDIKTLEHHQRLIDTVPTGTRGMRWIHQPEAVLCHAEREIDAPYDDFVSRVDIAAVGRRFGDVVRCTTEILRRDPAGRATLQLERITVRPRPNYLAFLGGDDRDIYWLERIDYGPDERRIWIRTVHHPDSSTVHYDGYLAFARLAGRTHIAFLACRRLPMPRVLPLGYLERWPWLTRAVTENAFRRFFDVTMTNIVMSYHYRDVRIGRAPA